MSALPVWADCDINDLTGDLNGDCSVGLSDLMILISYWLDDSCLYPYCGDLNNIAGVNLSDFTILAENWLDNKSPLIITEFMASNNNTIDDGNGVSSDWLEIYNQGAATIDLGGWHLTDKSDELTKWQFPSGIYLAKDEFLLVFASGKEQVDYPDNFPYLDPAGYWHTNFKLKANGEFLALVEPDGVTIASQYAPEFPQQFEDISYGIAMGGGVSPLVSSGANANFLVPDNGDLGASWTQAGFDDNGWPTGPTGIGYETSGSDYAALIQTQVPAGTITAYVRHEFSVADPAAYINLQLRVKYDDGFVAYLNGVEVARANAPVTPEWNSSATEKHADIQAVIYEDHDISSYLHLLTSGENVLAVHALNDTSSSDMLILVELIGVTSGGLKDVGYMMFPTPGTANNEGFAGVVSDEVLFSKPGFTFTDSFPLTLSAGSSTADIYYTLDGSAPDETSVLYTAPISINTTTNVRARCIEPLKMPGPITSQSYIHLAPDVADFSSVLPIIVIENFGAGDIPNKGTSSDGRGVVQVPRQPINMSIFDRVGTASALANEPDLSHRMGIRVRGSSSSTHTKKPYSVEAWHEQDNDTDITPFQMPAESDWVMYAPTSYDRTLIYNSWIFELSNQIGFYAPRTQFVETFINTEGGSLSMADYAGLYIFMEKIKRDKNRVEFEELSADGTSGGWMINVGRMDPIPIGGVGTPRHFHTPGPDRILQTPPDNPVGVYTSDDHPEWYHSFFNFTSPDGYELNTVQRAAIEDWVNEMEDAVYAVDYDDPETGYAKYIDVDSFIDHYWLQNLPKNNDAIVLSTWMYRKSPADKLMMGPIWDFDRSIQYNGTATSSLRFASDRIWYKRMFTDAEFEQKYIDRWQELRRDRFATANLHAIIDAQSAEITEPIAIANGTSDWPGKLVDMKNWLTSRTTALDAQWDDGVAFNQNGGAIDPGFALTMTNLNGSGTIYYTTDGSDPRLRGGSVASTASVYSGPITLTETTRVKARVKDGSDWSGWNQATFVIGDISGSLRITEIMYHPVDPNDEYIELKNIGNETIDLHWVSFYDGISFTFPQLLLTPQEYVLVVRSQVDFEDRYGTGYNVAGEYLGKLNNDGEDIKLVDPAGQAIMAFEYKDAWYDITDGEGFSLTMLNPTGSGPNIWSSKEGWRPSAYSNGSPGAEDTGIVPEPGAVVINELLAHSDTEPYDWIETHNTTDNVINIGGWFLSDSNKDDPNRMKYEIAAGTTIDPNGYIVFYENLHFGNAADPGCHTPFQMSENGETIYLQSGQAGVLTGYYEEEDFGASEPDVAFGRYLKSELDGGSNFVAMNSNTPDSSNTYPKVGPLVISEIMYHPLGNSHAEYVELLNISDVTITLCDLTTNEPWKFADDGGIEFFFPTPAVTVEPNERILLVKDLAMFNLEFSAPPGSQIFVWGSLGSLDNGGEKIQLSQPGDVDEQGHRQYIRVDRVNYDNDAPWPPEPDGYGKALQRIVPQNYGNDVINWMAAEPSPGY